ncbi:MAG: hypothetical protein PHY73_05545 [Candidatus Omnitrophica bacterium]|nr:hypothetical protein [Candidatus Omnitrophota bacterium]
MSKGKIIEILQIVSGLLIIPCFFALLWCYMPVDAAGKILEGYRYLKTGDVLIESVEKLEKKEIVTKQEIQNLIVSLKEAKRKSERESIYLITGFLKKTVSLLVIISFVLGVLFSGVLLTTFLKEERIDLNQNSSA